MSSLLEKSKAEGERLINAFLSTTEYEQVSPEEVQDTATNVAIEIFSDMGFGADDWWDGDTGKLYAHLETFATKRLNEKSGRPQ